ncbi:MAG: hypothetical protein Q9181_000991 [Wetmoreana brouardii]
MLFDILILATMATLGSALPQAPAQIPAQSSLPKCLSAPSGVSDDFCLVEYYNPEEKVKVHFTTCYNQDTSPAPKAPNWAGDMQKCLEGYNGPNWDGQDCGGVGWYKASHTYDNPQNCYDACHPCMEWFISKGSTSGSCWDVFGATTPNYDGKAPTDVKRQTYCNMGYHLG